MCVYHAQVSITPITYSTKVEKWQIHKYLNKNILELKNSFDNTALLCLFFFADNDMATLKKWLYIWPQVTAVLYYEMKVKLGESISLVLGYV